MSEVYIVIQNSGNAAPDVCEAYSDKQQALGRATALAHFAAVHHPLWDTTPREKVDAHGNQYWIFLSNSGFDRHYVAVYYKKVEDKVTSKSFTIPSPFPFLGPPPAPTPPPPKDDPADPSLPFGWTHAGNPVTTASVDVDPYNIVPVYSLKLEQQWALVTVRIQKRPAFTIHVPGTGTCDQAGALDALRNKTTLGQEILMLECIWLDKFLNDAKGKMDEEESSSESSSEEY